jgi:hypothetical protein
MVRPAQCPASVDTANQDMAQTFHLVTSGVSLSPSSRQTNYLPYQMGEVK